MKHFCPIIPVTIAFMILLKSHQIIFKISQKYFERANARFSPRGQIIYIRHQTGNYAGEYLINNVNLCPWRSEQMKTGNYEGVNFSQNLINNVNLCPWRSELMTLSWRLERVSSFKTSTSTLHPPSSRSFTLESINQLIKWECQKQTNKSFHIYLPAYEQIENPVQKLRNQMQILFGSGPSKQFATFSFFSIAAKMYQVAISGRC